MNNNFTLKDYYIYCLPCPFRKNKKECERMQKIVGYCENIIKGVNNGTSKHT